MRWINCPSHQDSRVPILLEKHFNNSNRRALLIGGAGFDPRASVFPLQLHKVLGNRLRALMLKEERPETSQDLVLRARKLHEKLVQELTNLAVVPVPILSADLAVIGGRSAVTTVNQELCNDLSDIVVDVSALSSGISFPIIRFVLNWIDKNHTNVQLHIVLAGQSLVDRSIFAEPLDKSKEIYGFKGKYGLVSKSDAAKLWMPQLALDQREALNRIYDEIQPHDVCPILPFPSRDPRVGDTLLKHFADEVLDTWQVSSRNVIYAAEDNPLDLYRTVLRIDDERKVVFEKAGESLLFLTATGTKALALGALMAAIDRDLPVRYVESIAYNVEWNEIEHVSENTMEYLHLWLAGEPYLNNY